MRDWLVIAAVLLAVLVAGLLGFRVLFAEPAAPGLTVQEVEGSVVRDAAGVAVPAVAGDIVGAEESVRTGPGSQVVLTLGESTRLVLASESTLRVVEQRADGVDVELEAGRVRATVRPGAGALGVRAAGRAVRAEDAEFTVARDGELVQVEAEAGSLRLEGFGNAASLVAGERVVVSGGSVSPVGAIPEALLLRVEWPEATTTRLEHVEVRGRTEPWARVEVRSQAGRSMVTANGAGGFVLSVGLVEGENAVSVRVEDLLGRAQEATWAVVRDTTGPTGQFRVEY